MRKSARIAALIAGPALVIGIAASAAVPAMASASTAFKTSTVSPEHSDTTGVTCSACLQGPNGPIWANDHLKEAITVASAGAPDHYNVTIAVGGSSFQGFADPRASGEAGSDGTNSGGPLFSQGSISGSIHYNDITSSNSPQALPATLAPDTGLTATLNQLFNGGITAPAVSTHYSFNYKPSATTPPVDPTGNSADSWTQVYSQAG
jgi:hypothetical protein